LDLVGPCAGHTGDVDNYCVLAGRYHLGERLGQGGMGQVRRAWDGWLDRPVAIKTLELDRAEPSAAARFRLEARTMAWLTHPNIVTVFDTGTDGTTAFLVMELLRGPSLEAKLERTGALPAADAVAVGMQVAAALAAAHAAGVVHRDVKPANIGYAADGVVKVLDFGIAQLAGTLAARQTRLTQTGMVLGTAAYLSPEQASGAAAGPRSDLYALGCVLFAMLTGGPPFTGDSPVAVCAQHLVAEPPDLAAVRPGCPAQLVELVGELLCKDPAARPRDATVVHDRLASAGAGDSGAAKNIVGSQIAVAPPGPAAAPVPPAGTPARASAPLDLPPGRARTRPRRRITAATAATAALAAAVAVPVMLTGSPQAPHIAAGAHTLPATAPPPAAPRPTARPAAVQRPVPPPSVTPRPTPRPRRRRPLTPAQAIAAFSAAVTRAKAAGDLVPPAAQELLNRMHDLSTTIASGNRTDAGHKVADLIHDLSNLAHGGQLTAAGQRILAAPLAALERAIPPQT
jgi:eukaryotic-like serine/threonine-protein kinase